jgi:cyclopropane-fatty-acyl-phospholipid synthase
MSLSKKLFYKLLQKIKFGRITLREGNDICVFTGAEGSHTHAVTLDIHQPSVFKTILLQGSIGAGKSYMQGDWQADDLKVLIEIFIRNSQLLTKIESVSAKITNFFQQLAKKFKPNNIIQVKDNILQHYDLSNEFFELILDPSMMYSCAIYQPEDISQEAASYKKIDTICQLLNLKASDHILEIGSGWGGFAIYAAKHYGCKITTTTISDKQYAYVKDAILQQGLEKQITLIDKDYRELSGQYDKIVSIEMIESIGHQYFEIFFQKCNALLKPNGLLFLQTITINDKEYGRARNEIDFIKKYIFPGGCLPSQNIINHIIATQTQLQLIHLQEIGDHYVKTLMDWHARLNANIDAIKKLNFTTEFIRMWEFYFCYCAAGFATSYINNIHVLWQKRANDV